MLASLSWTSLHGGLFLAAAVPSTIFTLATLKMRRARPVLAPLGCLTAALVLAFAGQAPLTIVASIAIAFAGQVVMWPTADKQSTSGVDPTSSIRAALSDSVWPSIIIATAAVVILDTGAFTAPALTVSMGLATALTMGALGSPRIAGSPRITMGLLLLSILALWLAVPDTEGVVVMLGGLIPVAVLVCAGDQGDVTRWVGRGMACAAPLFVIAVGHGSVSGEPSIVIGSLATLGLLLTIPVLSLVTEWVPRRRTTSLLIIQVVAGVVVARGAAVRSTTVRATAVAICVVVVSTAAAVLITNSSEREHQPQ